MLHTLPIELSMRECANGETIECFLTVDGEPIYGPQECGVFLTKPTVSQALRAALRLAAQEVPS